MKYSGWALVALTLLTGCGSAIAPDQADGKDCNYTASKNACSPTSFCDPGEPASGGGYLRKNTYGLTRDKTDITGTCRPKGAVGAGCRGVDQCSSGKCVYAGAAPAIGSTGLCQ